MKKVPRLGELFGEDTKFVVSLSQLNDTINRILVRYYQLVIHNNMNPQPTYVMIEPAGEKVKVHYAWTTFLTDERELGMTNCWIPAFDLYFCAKSKEAGNEKSKAMMKVFMSHYLDRRNGLKSLALELHKLGFKANQDQQIMTDLVRNKPVKAKFCSAIHEIPEEFIGAERTENELELSM